MLVWTVAGLDNTNALQQDPRSDHHVANLLAESNQFLKLRRVMHVKRCHFLNAFIDGGKDRRAAVLVPELSNAEQRTGF